MPLSECCRKFFISLFAILAVCSIHPSSFIRCVSSLAYRCTPRKRACVVWASREKKLIYSCHSSLLFYVRTIEHTLFSTTYYANVNLYVCCVSVFCLSHVDVRRPRCEWWMRWRVLQRNGRHSLMNFLLSFAIANVLPLHCVLGLYGNDDLHNGLLEVLTSGRKVDNIISMVRNQTHKLENTLSNNIQPQLAELRDIFDGPASNQTALSQLILSLTNVQENVTAATNAAGDIRRPLMQVTMTSFLAVNI